MTQHNTSNHTPTPLDHIAHDYWQSYLNKTQIDGGIAYQKQLFQCHLDGTVISLQQLDKLLSLIRRDLKQKNISEAQFLQHKKAQGLLWFMAFYAGRVLANASGQKMMWYGQLELKHHYPKLALNKDDFYQFMAMPYQDNVGHWQLFFALEPIGKRLFGSIDRPFYGLMTDGQVHSQVDDGLYQAVLQRLPKVEPQSQSQPQPQPQPQPMVETSQLTQTTSKIQKPSTQPITPSRQQINTTPQTPNASHTTPISAPTPSPSHTISHVQSHQAKASTEQEPLKSQKVNAPSATVKSTKDIFSELREDLDTVDVPQAVDKDEYQQACQALQKSQTLKHQPSTSPSVIKQSYQTALKQLYQAASAGHTGAMLQLAMCYFLGDGMVKNEEKGLAWVQKASQNDCRAQKLLSKFYYQGYAVEQDMTKGEYWLEMAANNGHPEAKKVQQQMQWTKSLLAEREEDKKEDKKYQFLLAAVVVFSILVILIVNFFT